jgi:hypothetical protein
MKKIFIFLFLILSFTTFAQVSEEEAIGADEPEVLFSDETYEEEMLAQKQEDIPQEPSLFAEETSADEEDFDTEADYNY